MKKLPVFLILLVVFALFLTSCAAKPEQGVAPAPENVQRQSLIAEGSLQPINSLAHSFSVSGQVAEVLVKNGEVVKAGQALVRLNNSSAAELVLPN